MVRESAELRGGAERGGREHWRGRNLHLDWAEVPWMRKFVKTHQTVCLRPVHRWYVNYALI